jgi:hypothetical protein
LAKGLSDELLVVEDRRSQTIGKHRLTEHPTKPKREKFSDNHPGFLVTDIRTFPSRSMRLGGVWVNSPNVEKKLAGKRRGRLTINFTRDSGVDETIPMQAAKIRTRSLTPFPSPKSERHHSSPLARKNHTKKSLTKPLGKFSVQKLPGNVEASLCSLQRIRKQISMKPGFLLTL